MIDLHIHTDNSDGQYDVITILKKAESKKLKVISIADHDTASAYKLIDNVSKYFSGKLITGIELECLYNGILIHILGYNIDVEKISKEEFIIKNSVNILEKQNKTLDFFKQVCDDLKIVYTKNLKITEKNLMANDVIRDDIIKYKENNEILEKYNIRNSGFYSGHVCNPKSPFYVDQTKEKEDIYSVVRMIKEAGGICFLAHPFFYNVENTEALIEEIYSLDLIDGIECYHYDHTKENTEYLINYCNEKNLKKSGGSDFHSDKHFLGYGNNGLLKIEDDIINDWM